MHNTTKNKQPAKPVFHNFNRAHHANFNTGIHRVCMHNVAGTGGPPKVIQWVWIIRTFGDRESL